MPTTVFLRNTPRNCSSNPPDLRSLGWFGSLFIASAKILLV
jgi:hypothetical protein